MPVLAARHCRHSLSVRRLLRVLIAYDDLIFAIVRLGSVCVNVLVILCLVRCDAVAQAIVASKGLLITQLCRSMRLLVVTWTQLLHSTNACFITFLTIFFWTTNSTCCLAGIGDLSARITPREWGRLGRVTPSLILRWPQVPLMRLCTVLHLSTMMRYTKFRFD